MDNNKKINDYIALAHEHAKSKGFWDGSQNIGEKLMLIVTEVAEAMEAHRGRNQKDPSLYKHHIEQTKRVFNKDLFEMTCKDSFEDELADAVIRIFDLCGYCGIDLDFHISHKMEYNKTREKLHGKKL